jgi:nitric oxide dioxygenase
MLSASARPYIDASVPVLREHGLAITRQFYAQMFSAHPKLKNVFNMGNQANGSQQNSLAAALFAYAANIDNAAALSVVAERIVHKHAAVGIKPAHYPIVARHLIGAIKQVLGEAATPELLAAWDEAYWLLAGELIAAEARVYERAGRGPGELMALVVSDVRPESDDVSSFYLKTQAGGSPGAFQPGQYVSVAVDLPGEDKLRQLRQYSLSDSPDKPYWRLSIKRERDAQGPEGRVSNHLHDSLVPGDKLEVSAAFGTFMPSLASDRPLALLSAGVGITPMMSVLHALPCAASRPVLFAYAARSRAHAVFLDEIESARRRFRSLTTRVWLEQAAGAGEHTREGRMTLTPDLLEPFRDADFYLCGPVAFMREQWRALVQAGVSPTRLHREVFGPEALDHLL